MTIHKGHWPEPAAGLVAVAREYPDTGSARAAFEARANGAEGLVSFTACEWTSAEAHRAALAAPGADGIGTTDGWKKVRTYPGMSGGSVKRYRPIVSAVAA
ncbi:MAG TPA: hypothetical protein VFG15_13350 [Amycolatopsis sp.]|nr:hypothetical protein [Amycolatopsis sp.]